MARDLKSEADSVMRGLEVFGVIDEKNAGFDVVCFSQLAEEDLGERGRRRKEPDVKQFVCLRISSGVQPELLVVDSNHGFIKRNVIRRSAGFGL